MNEWYSTSVIRKCQSEPWDTITDLWKRQKLEIDNPRAGKERGQPERRQWMLEPLRETAERWFLTLTTHPPKTAIPVLLIQATEMNVSQAWWGRPVIPALRRPAWGYTVRTRPVVTQQKVVSKTKQKIEQQQKQMKTEQILQHGTERERRKAGLR